MFAWRLELAGWHFVIARDSITPRQAFKAMDVLLTKALALDSLYPDALGGRADYLLYWERDWPRARSLYERAVALDPNSSNLRWGYSQALGTVGLLKEALVQQHVAAELDPTGQNLCYLGHAYVRANRLGEAEALMRRRLAAAPDEMCSRFVLGYTLASLGRYGDGIRLLEEVDQAWGQNLSLAFLGTAFARAGRAVDAERVLTRLRQRATRAYVDPALMAMVEVALGRRSAALKLLAQSVEAGGETSMYYLGPNPWFDPLRNDPRFRALRRQVGVYVDGP